jgi:hypothetical protein
MLSYNLSGLSKIMEIKLFSKLLWIILIKNKLLFGLPSSKDFKIRKIMDSMMINDQILLSNYLWFCLYFYLLYDICYTFKY